MDRSVLQRYSSRPDAEAHVPDEPDVEAIDDFECFGCLRGGRDRCAMLVLRKKSGSCLAISYSWIERIEFDPTAGILIVAGPTTVTIQGRNLNAEVRQNVRLFEGVTHHRVPWIQEATQPEIMASTEGACVVESVDW